MQMVLAENHWGFLSEWYLTRPTLQEKMDEKYGKGAAGFIGKAMQAFSAPKGRGITGDCRQRGAHQVPQTAMPLTCLTIGAK